RREGRGGSPHSLSGVAIRRLPTPKIGEHPTALTQHAPYVVVGIRLMSSIEEYAAEPRSRRLRRLALTFDQLRAAIEDSAAETIGQRPSADAWAPVEVICHLRDSEEWFLTRCRWLLSMDDA